MAGIETLIHGRKPEIAKFKATDPIEMLQKLLSGEITDWPQIQQLSDLFQQQQFQQMGGVDLWKGILGLGGEDTQKTLEQARSMLGGNIPQDVADKVMRSSAFQSLGAGSLGGPMGSALAARNLGLTSLDMIKQGADLATSGGNAAQRWASLAQSTMLPPSSYLYSPQWFTQYMAQQEQAREAQKQRQFNTDAAPDPAAAGIAGTVTGIIGAIYGHGGGGNNYSDYQGQYNRAVAGNIPTSQFSGLGGTVSNFLGGNLHFGGDQPYAFGPNASGMPSDVSTPGYPVYPQAIPVEQNQIPVDYNTRPNLAGLGLFSSFNQGA